MISGKRARCSLSKLVTDGIFHVQKIVRCWWEMHPPHPPPGSATGCVVYPLLVYWAKMNTRHLACFVFAGGDDEPVPLTG